MKWKKKGLIFKTEKQFPWMNSHAQCPTAVLLKDRIRIFFSARLENQQSLPTYIDVERENPRKIIYLNPKPVIEFGRKGTFDENGIIPSYFIWKDNLLYFYYAGWSQCKNVPYKNFTGLAISNDQGKTFNKYSEAPVLNNDEYNPLSATGPCIVMINNHYYAIYSTGIEWIEVNGKLEHIYLLTIAISEDAIHWKSFGKIIIQPEREFVAHCKPAVVFKDGIYHLWFSTRGSYNFRNAGKNAYRIGYAWSYDFITWNRDDKNVGIDISEGGWDSEMICYPHIIQVDNKYYMFYNGNGFGSSGFGYAELNFD